MRWGLWGLAVGVALPVLLVPISNPDLFWHLSAARWIAAHHALPRADFLTFTAAGSPWSDFEWLSQLIYYAVYSLAGMAGLWALKVLLIAACGAVVLRVCALYKVEQWVLAFALVLWASGLMTFADIRPDLFSMLFFAVLLYRLESFRLGKGKLSLGATILLFCLWSNLHAGFAFGLLLLACYAVAPFLRKESDPQDPGTVARHGLAALGGTLINPYGVGPYLVILDHWKNRADLTPLIQEWQPVSIHNSYHWPFWPVLALCAVLLALRARKRDLPLGLTAMTVFLAESAAAHGRMASYFNTIAAPFIVILCRDAGFLKKRAAPLAAAAAALAYAVYLPTVLGRFPWDHFFLDVYLPRGAAEFMDEQRAVFEPLRVYNPWEWGGYLGFRLGAWHKVFVDGRYIFHSRLRETNEAAGRVDLAKALMEKYKLDAALLRDVNIRFPTTRLYPGGKTKAFQRPWYLEFFPRERWALVYWDAKALLFVDRAKVPKDWLMEHEYRYVRPFDDEAFADAMERKELPILVVKLETVRHRIDGAIYLSRRAF